MRSLRQPPGRKRRILIDEPSLSEALADPIVQALMASDRVDRRMLEQLAGRFRRQSTRGRVKRTPGSDQHTL